MRALIDQAIYILRDVFGSIDVYIPHHDAVSFAHTDHLLLVGREHGRGDGGRMPNKALAPFLVRAILAQ